MITITCRLCGASTQSEDDAVIGLWHREHGPTCPGKTDAQLWAAYQSVYEPGSRYEYDPDEQPDIESRRALAAFGVDLAAEYLVLKDQFSERTLRLLDELRASIAAGQYVTDLTAPEIAA
jgi:hypothetical protein